MRKLVQLLGIIIYPFIGTAFGLVLCFTIHPLAIFIPMLPALALAIREVNRRSKVIISEAFETSPEKWRKALDEYLVLANFSRRTKRGKKSNR